MALLTRRNMMFIGSLTVAVGVAGTAASLYRPRGEQQPLIIKDDAPNLVIEDGWIVQK